MMLMIAEKLNSSIPSTLELFRSGSSDAVLEIILAQAAAGADYLDVNTALLGADELPRMIELGDMILSHTECGVMLDSPSPDILLAAAEHFAGNKIMLNSFHPGDLSPEVCRKVIELGVPVVVMPTDGEDPVSRAGLGVDTLVSAGFSRDLIYVDCMVEALATDGDAPIRMLDRIRQVRDSLNVRTVCGLSNVSFGLPCRKILNTAFFVLCAERGLDAAILSASDTMLADMSMAVDALLGRDEYCMNYISYLRENGRI